MGTRQRIARRARGADRPPPWTLAATAVVGLAAGLGLVRLSLSEPHPMSQPLEDSGAMANAASPDGTRGTARSAPDPDPTLAPTRGRGAAPPTAPDAGAESQTDAGVVEPPPPTLSVYPGRLAYTQCAGLERPGTAFPCPRDRRLEAAAWRILMALPECSETRLPEGSADVRLHFGRTGSPEVSVRSVGSDAAIPPDDLLACTGSSLRGLRTSLRSPRLVVSFRFRMR